MKQIGITELKPCFLPKSKVLFGMMKNVNHQSLFKKNTMKNYLILI